MLLGAAVSHYRYDAGRYPNKLSDLAVAGTGTLQGYGPWIAEVKKDPWGNDYVLLVDAQRGADETTAHFIVYSTGGTARKEYDAVGKVPSLSAAVAAGKLPADVIGYFGR